MLFAVVLFGSRPLPSAFIGSLYLLYTKKKDQEGGKVMLWGGGAGPNKTIIKSVGRLQFITSTGMRAFSIKQIKHIAVKFLPCVRTSLFY